MVSNADYASAAGAAASVPVLANGLAAHPPSPLSAQPAPLPSSNRASTATIPETPDPAPSQLVNPRPPSSVSSNRDSRRSVLIGHTPTGAPIYTELDLEIQQLLSSDPSAPLHFPPVDIEGLIIDDSIMVEDIPAPLTTSPLGLARSEENFLISPEAIPVRRRNDSTVTERSQGVGRNRDSWRSTGADSSKRSSSGTTYSKRDSAAIGSGSTGATLAIGPAGITPPTSGSATPQPRARELDVSAADDPIFQSELAKLSDGPDDIRLSGMNMHMNMGEGGYFGSVSNRPPLERGPPQPNPSPRPLPPTPTLPPAATMKLDGPPVIPPTMTEIASTFRASSNRDSLVLLGLDSNAPLSTILEAAKNGGKQAEYKRGSKLFDWEELMAEAKARVEMEGEEAIANGV